ncbi:MAG: aminodeoxychorismate lyase [Nitrosomonadales bacterium]|nr:aminodeoxychorismate lyase [Nitrosomonadales bacterium]
MAKNFLINGDKKKSLSPFDRGLAFGDGAFRTFLVENNKPKQWNAHYRKLAKDLKSIDIPSPSDKLLLSDIQKLFPEKGIFIAKIIVTRGESTSGYDFKKEIKPTRILLKMDYDKEKYALFKEGVHLTASKIRASDTSHAGIKHLNRLENVLARKGLANKFFDAIMLDANDNICDCARSSLFIRYGKNLFTSSNKRYGIHGVTKKIIEKNIKKLNLTINYSPLKLDQLKEADEVIVTNSIFGALPVLSFKNIKWNKGKLANLINKLINESH